MEPSNDFIKEIHIFRESIPNALVSMEISLPFLAAVQEVSNSYVYALLSTTVVLLVTLIDRSLCISVLFSCCCSLFIEPCIH